MPKFVHKILIKPLTLNSLLYSQADTNQRFLAYSQIIFLWKFSFFRLFRQSRQIANIAILYRNVSMDHYWWDPL